MKTFVTLFALFNVSLFSFSQTNEYLISDKSKIRWYVSAENKDTVYLLREPPATGKCIIYYDENKKQKAIEVDYMGKDENQFNETRWYKSGELKSIRKMSPKMDTLYNIYYYENKKIKEKNINLWIEDNSGWTLIIDTTYFDNGQLKRTPIDWTSYKKQFITVFYPSGAKHFEINWVNGTMVDEFKEYYETGAIKVIGNYLNPKDLDPGSLPSSRHSIENGTWSYYDENGILIKEQIYENGTLLFKIEK